MGEIEILEMEEDVLLEKLEANRDKQRDYHTKNFIRKYKVDIGNKVSWIQNGKEKIGVISKFEYLGVKVHYLFIEIKDSVDEEVVKIHADDGFLKNFKKIN